MRIKNIREDKHITEKELANAIGAKAGTLSRYESDKLSPNAIIINR